MKLQRWNSSFQPEGYPCKCDPKDSACTWPNIAGSDLIVAHHSYCPRFKLTQRAFWQRRMWLALSKAKWRKSLCRCCRAKNGVRRCVNLVTAGVHCRHCPIYDKIMGCLEQALTWGRLVYRMASEPQPEPIASQ